MPVPLVFLPPRTLEGAGLPQSPPTAAAADTSGVPPGTPALPPGGRGRIPLRGMRDRGWDGSQPVGFWGRKKGGEEGMANTPWQRQDVKPGALSAHQDL